MTSNSLTENEEVHLKGPMIPDPGGQLAELIV